MFNYLTINTTAELICLLIAVFTLPRDKNRSWRYFWVYLLITLTIELSSIYLRRHGTIKTTWLYSILTIFEIGFLAALFRTILATYVRKWTVFNSGVAIVSLLFIMETIIYQGLNVRHNLTLLLLGILVVIASLSYLNFLLKDDSHVSLSRDANFWWVVGALLFYFGSMSLTVLFDVLKGHFEKPGPFFGYTFKILNVLFYAVWSYAFICRRWTSIK
jgi:hypothetical protein